MLKRIILYVVCTLIFLTLQSGAFAADFETSCNDTECTPETYPNVFDPSFKWYPTASETRTITITNTSSTSQFVGHRADDLTISGGANLASVLDLVVRRQRDNAVVWSGTLQTLATGPEFGLSSLPVGQSETYIYTITMQNVGNEYQNTSAQFDLVFGYIVPTLTPTPTNTPVSSTNNTGNGGGGSVQGASTSSNPPVCNDTPPTGAPLLQAIIPGTNTASLTWSTAPGQVSYYLIAYGTSPGNYLYGAQVGTTTSFTVQGLSGNQTYYFVVRAGNGCAPGPFSNEVVVSPQGIQIAGIAEGFTEDVLGDTTLEGEVGGEGAQSLFEPVQETGDVQAAEDQICRNAPWWWVVVVAYGTISLLLLIFGARMSQLMRLFVQLIVGLIAIVLLIYSLCSWYMAVLLIFILAVVSYFLIEGYHNEK